jgi:hypothetical protein
LKPILTPMLKSMLEASGIRRLKPLSTCASKFNLRRYIAETRCICSYASDCGDCGNRTFVQLETSPSTRLNASSYDLSRSAEHRGGVKINVDVVNPKVGRSRVPASSPALKGHRFSVLETIIS